MWASYLHMCQRAACAAHVTLVCWICLNAVFHISVVAHLLFCSCAVQSHCFSIASLHHPLMYVLFCSALLCLPSSSSSCCCILCRLPVPGAFCVFSCACPSPSRSEHWGAHSDPSGRETAEDQPQTQAGGRSRYGSMLDRMGQCLVKKCMVYVAFMKLRLLNLT